MNIVIALYIVIAISFTYLSMFIFDRHRSEVESILGWFGDWNIVIIAAIIAGAFWPVSIFVILKRMNES